MLVHPPPPGGEQVLGACVHKLVQAAYLRVQRVPELQPRVGTVEERADGEALVELSTTPRHVEAQRVAAKALPCRKLLLERCDTFAAPHVVHTNAQAATGPLLERLKAFVVRISGLYVYIDAGCSTKDLAIQLAVELVADALQLAVVSPDNLAGVEATRSCVLLACHKCRASRLMARRSVGRCCPTFQRRQSPHSPFVA